MPFFLAARSFAKGQLVSRRSHTSTQCRRGARRRKQFNVNLAVNLWNDANRNWPSVIASMGSARGRLDCACVTNGHCRETDTPPLATSSRMSQRPMENHAFEERTGNFVGSAAGRCKKLNDFFRAVRMRLPNLPPRGDVARAPPNGCGFPLRRGCSRRSQNCSMQYICSSTMTEHRRRTTESGIGGVQVSNLLSYSRE